MRNRKKQENCMKTTKCTNNKTDTRGNRNNTGN